MTQKYLNKFADHSGYAAFVQSAEFITPSVSYCIEENEVHYNPIPRHEYVDLGLPSGTLWATENIKDANGNELYFAWGETQGYTAEQVGTDKYFAWEGNNADYKYGVYDSSSTPNYGMTKYNKTDNLTILASDDDAATILWGENWCMPTEKQFQELITNTTTAWTTNGKIGMIFTSMINGNSIFFPALGNADNNEVLGVGEWGDYWSCGLNTDSINNALRFELGSDDATVSDDFRYIGFSVRPVRTEVMHRYVDLGLPSGTLWATDNIKDANGNDLYFAWGETQGYTSSQIGVDKNFCSENDRPDMPYDYVFSPEDEHGFTKYNDIDEKIELDPEDDAAKVLWKSGWHIPTKEQFDELLEYTNHDAVLGDDSHTVFTSVNNGNTLYLRHLGMGTNGVWYNNSGQSGYYWSSSVDSDSNTSAYGLSIGDEYWTNPGTRGIGASIRPVRESNPNV